MADWQAKEIDEFSYWVFKDPTKPMKVKARKQKDRVWAECACPKFLRIGNCEHVMAVMKISPDKKWIVHEKKLQVDEHIGGDNSKEIINMIKSLSF